MLEEHEGACLRELLPPPPWEDVPAKQRPAQERRLQVVQNEFKNLTCCCSGAAHIPCCCSRDPKACW